ncbi:WD40/YVTN/BNR-like repeat-containing protein, partial [Longimicrobium sp.]|uniref:WD40/YVTN/BNR-like repeat-containing protein n=1 Tax=Longimicrobium sp. TaxID=2029185 RepID=UPI0039C9D777
MFRTPVRHGTAVAALLALCACTDHLPSGPAAPDPANLTRIDCQVSRAAAQMTCAAPAPTGSGSRNVIVGGQGTHVRLASSNLVYHDQTGIFNVDVTVQNLLDLPIGTPDGTLPLGVRVFFVAPPAVTSGTGSVEVSADGSSSFTADNQAYYAYPGILQPRAISQPRTWEFALQGDVQNFTFSVYVDAMLPAEQAILRWSRVQGGSPVSSILYSGVWGTSANNVYAVGARGTITHFDGNSWESMTSPTGYDLRGITGGQTGTMLAAGAGGTLLRSDGGNWSVVTTGLTDRGYLGVSGSAARALAVGWKLNGGVYEGLVSRSTDDGLSWTPATQTGGKGRQYNAVAVSADSDFVVGFQQQADNSYAGLILRRAAGDGAWTETLRAVAGANQRFTGVWAAGGTVYVSGLRVSAANEYSAVLLRSTDAGPTWQETVIPSTTLRSMGGVWASGLNAWAVGIGEDVNGLNKSVVYRSTDGGATWTESVLPSAGGNGVTSVWGTAAGDVFAVGGPGLVLRNTGGAWSTATEARDRTLRGAWVDGDNVYAVGSAENDEMLFLRSTDNGATWTERLDAADGGETLRDVASSGSTIVAVGSRPSASGTGRDGLVRTSTNGGASWTTRTFPSAVGGREL